MRCCCLEVADAAVDRLADLLGGDFGPQSPYNRPKQPNSKQPRRQVSVSCGESSSR